MTHQAQLQKLVDDLAEPVMHASGAAKLLRIFADGLDDGAQTDALYFVANSLDDAVNKMANAHNALYHLMRQDGSGEDPTPLKAV